MKLCGGLANVPFIAFRTIAVFKETELRKAFFFYDRAEYILFFLLKESKSPRKKKKKKKKRREKPKDK